jgi:hypothetical protein
MPIKFEGKGPLPRARAIEDASGIVLVPIMPVVCMELERDRRTVTRWISDPDMKFPPVRRIRNRLYVVRAELEAWKRDVLLVAVPVAKKTASASEARQTRKAERAEKAAAMARARAAKLAQSASRAAEAAAEAEADAKAARAAADARKAAEAAV